MKTRLKSYLIKIGLPLFFLVFVLEILLFLPKPLSDGIPPALKAPPPETDQTADQVMKGVHLVEAGGEKKEWELWSEEARSLKGQDVWALIQVKATFFSESGNNFKVVGNTGLVQVAQKNITVSGNVKTRSTSGYLFMTESVTYTSRERQLVAPGRVELVSPSDRDGQSTKVVGRSLKANMNDNLIELYNDVRAERIVKPNRQLLIKSNSAAFYAKENLVKFYGNVIIDFEAMRITGARAQFKHDPKSNEFQSMTVNEGVKVSDADKWATADTVTVDFINDKYLFQGSPRLVQNNDELIGEEIVFLDGGRRVKVLGAKALVDEKRLEEKGE